MNHSIRTSAIRRTPAITCLAMLVLLLGACTSTAVAPTSAMDSARDAIANAEQADARQFAGSELDEAKQEFAKAEQAIRDEHMEDAELLAQRARVSAELASARTESAKADEVNRELARGSKALTEEMQRSGDLR